MAETEQHQQDQQGDALGRADAAANANPAQDQQSDDLAAETDVTKLRHEAASRRRELRTVEKERDALRGRVDQHDRAEVERLVSGGLADPSDLWGAVELDAVRGEDGAITEEKVSEALAGLLKAKPHFAKPQHRVDLHQGARQEVAEPPSFGQALKSGGRR